MIVIVDYGMGNRASICKMVKKIGFDCIISSLESDLQQASLLILPGIGYFESAINKLKETNLFDTLDRLVRIDKKPVIGICLGMQLMTRYSEEGSCSGFGWIDAEVKKIAPLDAHGNKVIIPHMGWNHVHAQRNKYLLDNMPHNEARFYFVHSYYVQAKDEDVLLTADYNNEFCAAFYKDNIMGMQFHPEKSHKYGEALLSNAIREMQA